MKATKRGILGTISMFVLTVLFCNSPNVHAQSGSTNPLFRLEPGTNAWNLVVDRLSSTGALFLLQAPDLPALSASPTSILQTNTPLTNALRLPVLSASDLASQGFFSAIYWPGRSVEEFGDPEYSPDEPSPTMILLTSGAPTNLSSGQTFTVDFFITDPTGQLLDLSLPVAILVLRESDGVPHPDAQVSPPTGQMTNGQMRLQITLTATTPLDGYVLALGPATSRSLLGKAPKVSSALDGFLKTAFNLGPAPLNNPTREALLQTLNQRRSDNADPDPTWSYPLAGSGHPVSGTFGEWRGRNNNHVHRGLDLAAVAASTVVAARGGVVSCRRTQAGMGDYLVVDHGGGWFSRYLHLEGSDSAISVRVGQAVARGATLATRLYAVGNWPRHLHFEIRQGTDQAQWNVGQPGTGQDPLQTPAIFAVAAGSASPQLEQFGLTRQHLGQNAFVKGPPTSDVNGPVYLFANLVDAEPPGGGNDRLGLRAARFLPEGAAQAAEIRPKDDAAITPLLPPSGGQQKGFARYSGAHAANPDRLNYFRYWWQWDTSSYATDRRGPRSILLSGEDHHPSAADFHFTFGPQVKGGWLTVVGPQQYLFTNVAHLGTNTPAALHNPALFVQPDQYKLEIIQANGQPLGGVTWTGPVAGNYTRVFTTHLDEAIYTFTLPGGISANGLKLRVSSRLAPDIGHEVCFCAAANTGNMVSIPAGTFTMGSPDSEPARYSDEGPQTQVTISRGFCMGKYEVTQGEYLAVMGSNPSYFTGDLSRPVEQVSWNDAVAYCAVLTARERSAGRLPAGYVYRLPTEAEWEYACRAGTTTAFHYGNELRSGMANFYGYYEYLVGDPYHYNPSGVYLGRTTSVGSYAANAWGLYDMHGNVWEWCQDWYGTYPGGSVTDPHGASTGSYRVIRGGGWNNDAYYCRSANRYYYYPTDRNNGFIGFRVALAPGQP